MTVSVADEQSHPVPTERLQALAEHVLAAERVPAGMEVTLLLVDEAAIAELNRAHLGDEGPTDVLAFPIDAPGEACGDVPSVLGDVVLCPAVAQRQAQQGPGGQGPADQGPAGQSFAGADGLAGAGAAGELEMLVVHGILHLLGYDHAEHEQRRVMFARTDELLAAFRAGAGTGPPAQAEAREERP